MGGAWQRECVSSTPGSETYQQHLAESLLPTGSTAIELRELKFFLATNWSTQMKMQPIRSCNSI